MATAAKSAAIAELTDKFRNSGAAVLTEYRGLTVKQLTELRTSLASNATYAVVKNTLTELAAKEAGVTAFDGQLAGPSAIAFVTGDPVEAAKKLRDFAKANPLLVIKGGMLDGKPLTADDIKKLADLESREVLLAKLAGAMQASLSKAVYLFAAPLSQAARTVDALRAKVESRSGARPTPPRPKAEDAAGRSRGCTAGQRRRGRRRTRPPKTSPRVATRLSLGSDHPSHDATHGTNKRKERHHGEAQHRRAP
jgi:large subunit ribosomal protein L10